MRTVRARVTILVSSAVLSLTTLTGPALAAPMPDGPGVPAPAAPTVPQHVDPRTQSTRPVYDYASAIRESVYVDTTMDTDSDGQDEHGGGVAERGQGSGEDDGVQRRPGPH